MAHIESIRLQVTTRLPAHARWLINGTPLDFDFTRAQAPLVAVSSALVSGVIEEPWRRLYVFGEEDFAQGGGAFSYLCVHFDTGEILGLDVERTGEEVYFLSSDIDRFVRTFLKFDEALRLAALAEEDLLNVLNAIDPEGFPRSDWQSLPEHIA